jgi:hypothetical protein
MINYTAIFEVDGGISHGFGLSEPENYEERREFEFDEKHNSEQILAKAVCIAKKIAVNALSNPITELTKVTLLNLCGPNGEIDQKDFTSKYTHIGDKKGNSISFKKNDLGQIILEDHSFEKILRL